jgi:hypothetical protein
MQERTTTDDLVDHAKVGVLSQVFAPGRGKWVLMVAGATPGAMFG